MGYTIKKSDVSAAAYMNKACKTEYRALYKKKKLDRRGD